MKARLFANWITTLIGLGIIVFCLLLIYQGKESAEKLSGWLAVGLLFLRSKDSLLGLSPKDTGTSDI